MWNFLVVGSLSPVYTTCCQTGLTTGCIVYIQTFNRFRLTTGLTNGCIVYTAG